MTNKEKVLGLLQGKKTNGVIWAPRLKVWHDAHNTLGTLPEKYRGKSIVEIEKMMGAVAASSARVSWKQRAEQPTGHIVQLKFNTVEIEKKIEGNRELVTYKTPVGSVTETILINYEAIEKGYPMQRHTHAHLITEEKDYDIVEYIYKDMTFVPTYENYLKFEDALGDHGVPIIQLDRDPMYLIMQNLIGYNQFFFEFYDRKAKVEQLYRTLCDKAKEYLDIAIHSPATIILAAYHYDSMMMSPQFYDEYMKSYLEPFAVELNKRNKYLGFHADAETKGLLQNVLDTGITFIDCFATAPMVPTTLDDAIEVWGDRVVIYGGIPSNMLMPSICSDEDYNSYLDSLFKTIREKPCRILLGVADNVMPEADLERLEMITDRVAAFS